MKKNNNKYPTVTVLPNGAMSVSRYAEKEKITTSMVYKRLNTGKIKMVLCEGFNFVVPD